MADRTVFRRSSGMPAFLINWSISSAIGASKPEQSAARTHSAGQRRKRPDESAAAWVVREGFIGRCALTATTLLVCDGEAVVGYYSLAVGAWTTRRRPRASVKGLGAPPDPGHGPRETRGGSTLPGPGDRPGLSRTPSPCRWPSRPGPGDPGPREGRPSPQLVRAVRFEPSPLDPLRIRLLIKDARRGPHRSRSRRTRARPASACGAARAVASAVCGHPLEGAERRRWRTGGAPGEGREGGSRALRHSRSTRSSTIVHR